MPEISGYTVVQWVLFFYFYCLVGWIWESCFVSARKKHWVNRGFLHGPLLPIYGSGAVIVLVIAYPVRGNAVLVYLVGALSATVLEYLTGAAMESLFHVRYWDYTKKRFNLHGHICLEATLLWGVFSVAMTYAVHRPVADLLLKVPEAYTEPIAVGITMVFSGDLVLSVREALDLRELLRDITQNRLEIQRLQRRMDVVLAVIGDDAEKLKAWVAEGIDAGRDTLEQSRVAQGVEKLKETVGPEQKRMAQELEKLKAEIGRLRQEKLPGRNQMYRQAARILNRNPMAISEKYRNALDEIKRGLKSKLFEEDGRKE